MRPAWTQPGAAAASGVGKGVWPLLSLAWHRCAPKPSRGDLGAAQKQPSVCRVCGGQAPRREKGGRHSSQKLCPARWDPGAVTHCTRGPHCARVWAHRPRFSLRSVQPARLLVYFYGWKVRGEETSTGALSAICARRASLAKGDLRGDQRAQSTSAAPGTSPPSQASLRCPLGAVSPSAQDRSSTIPTSTQLCSTGRAPVEEPRNIS